MFNKSSKIVLFVCCLGIFFYQLSGQPDRTLSWDAFGYYLYLPSTFIQPHSGLEYRDWLQTIMEKYEPSETFYQVYQTETGQWLIRYTMGVALLESPFFFIAHLAAPILGYAQDGFSLPYQYCIAFGTLIYSFLGLFFIRKILLNFFSEKITALTLLLLAFATNFMQLSAEGSALTHPPAFCIASIVIWCTLKWHEKPQLKYALLIGLLCGLALLIRPTEVLIIVIPILWGIKDRITFIEKIRLSKKYLSHIIIMGILIPIVAFPQIYYWHKTTGHWLFNSYGNNPGEGLDLNNPHLLSFLFSFRKGWLIYTPIMLFAIFGFYHLFKYSRTIFLSVSVYFLLSLWIISSWTIWWYAGGSYSPRAILPVYAALTLPLGFFIKNISEKNEWIRRLFWSVLVLITALNLFQNYQYVKGIISREQMTFDYYVRVFGKTSVTEEDKRLLLPDQTNNTIPSFRKYSVKTIGKWDFEDSAGDSTISVSGKRSFKLDSIHQFSPGVNLEYKNLTSKPYIWIKAKVRYWLPADYQDAPPVIVITMNHNGKSYKYNAKEPSPTELTKGQWNTLVAEYITPEIRSKEDNLQVYIWHRGREALYIDDFTIDLFEEE